jgi:hypothetical protein
MCPGASPISPSNTGDSPEGNRKEDGGLLLRVRSVPGGLSLQPAGERRRPFAPVVGRDPLHDRSGIQTKVRKDIPCKGRDGKGEAKHPRHPGGKGLSPATLETAEFTREKQTSRMNLCELCGLCERKICQETAFLPRLNASCSVSGFSSAAVFFSRRLKKIPPW